MMRPSGVQTSPPCPSYLLSVNLRARPSSSFGAASQTFEENSPAIVTMVEESAVRPKLVVPYWVRSFVILVTAPSGYETRQTCIGSDGWLAAFTIRPLPSFSQKGRQTGACHL